MISFNNFRLSKVSDTSILGQGHSCHWARLKMQTQSTVRMRRGERRRNMFTYAVYFCRPEHSQRGTLLTQWPAAVWSWAEPNQAMCRHIRMPALSCSSWVRERRRTQLHNSAVSPLQCILPCLLLPDPSGLVSGGPSTHFPQIQSQPRPEPTSRSWPTAHRPPCHSPATPRHSSPFRWRTHQRRSHDPSVALFCTHRALHSDLWQWVGKPHPRCLWPLQHLGTWSTMASGHHPISGPRRPNSTLELQQ